MNHLSRRATLRGAGALLALPFMDSFGFRKFAAAAKPVANEIPKRMVFCGMGFGVTADEWFPDVKQTGSDYQLPKLLQPLAKHKDDFSIIQNLMHRYSADGHSGSTFWLTGANRYAIPGQNFHNTISVDQVAAAQWGGATRYTSLQLSAPGNSDGHGPGQSLAWNKFGKPVSGLDNPLAAFHKLFSDDTTPLEVRQEKLKNEQSVLDTILENARSLDRRLGREDRNKLSEYLQSVREIEVRIAKEESWLDVDKKKPSEKLREPGDSMKGAEEIRMMYDLMVAAMQVDATRVLTYRMPADSLIASLGATMSAHSMSHYAAPERRLVSRKRDAEHAKMLSDFLTKLKNATEADGSSLLDHCTVTFGSNISYHHTLKNCPTIVAGGGASIKQGRHLVMDDPKTPLCNLWLSILQGSGINAASHGDSTGVIDELFA
ncbi:MAG: DUF1552 domain-containing protein [Planctomycetota bacterium]